VNGNSGIVMQIRDRIKELRRVPAAQLRPNPRNWRTHNDAQRNALQGVLAEVGYAGALLARELPDGSLELIDGHLRAETTPEMTVPVLVLDVNEEEAKLILATHDPLAGMAGVAAETLESLLTEIHTDNPAVQAMWDSLTAAADDLLHDSSEQPPKEATIAPLFQVVVECGNETEQQTVYERLIAEGLKCRVLTL
jgi:hypothetical protein